MTIERRGFLATLGALGGAAATGFPRPLAAQATQTAQGWDMSWVEQLKGSHKQVFDMSDMERGLLVVKNWLDAWQSIYGLKHPQVNAVIGIASRAYPVNANDAMYRKYPLGEQWNLTDPDTGKPTLRNLHLSGGEAKVQALQARGTVFWMCNNALINISGRLAKAANATPEAVYADLRANLNPGVIVVPAHTMLLGICQERGCSYEML